MDGRVVDACLEQLGKDRDWLMAKLGDVNIKDIALAYYLADSDEIVVHRKD